MESTKEELKTFVFNPISSLLNCNHSILETSKHNQHVKFRGKV